MDNKTLQRAFNVLDRHLKNASVAQVGGFRPPDDPLTSWFGGNLVGLPDEPWPSRGGSYFAPVLQIRTNELPFVPGPLKATALVTVFVNEALPTHTPAKNGDGWCLRTYSSLDGLTQLPVPADARFSVRPFPIKWKLVKSEGPTWEDAERVPGFVEFRDIDGAEDVFFDRYHQYEHTKVGGWPSYIQGGPGIPPGEYVLQIGSEEKARWIWGDSGNAYIFVAEDGMWHLDWDCY